MSLRRSRRSIFSSRNSLFSFGGRKKKRTAGRTITTQRTDLGRRLEALEDRRLLAADVLFDTTTLYTAAEDGTSGTTGLFVEVSGDDLSLASPADRTLRIELFASGTASATDFSPSDQFVTIPALDYTTPITVSLLADDAGKVGAITGLDSGGVVIDDDLLIEGAETFGIEITDFGAEIILDNGKTSGVPSAAASVEIEDNDTATLVIVPGQSVSETGGGSFDVELVTIGNKVVGAGVLTGDVSFKVSDTLGGTADSKVDYPEFKTTADITFLSSASGGTKAVPLATLSDELIEGDETVEFSLGSLSGPGVVGGVTLGADETVIIDDDDTYDISFVPAIGSVAEPGATTTFGFDVKISFSSPGATLTEDVVVDLSAVGAGADPAEVTDFVLLTPSVIFLKIGTIDGDVMPGSVGIFGDDLVELDELVEVSSSVSAGPAGQEVPSADILALTITDDDKTALSISAPVAMPEGDAGTTTVTFTIDLTKGLDEDFDFKFDSTAGTADDPSDFTVTTASPVLLKSGATSVDIEVEISGDITVEDDETIKIAITNWTAGFGGIIDAGDDLTVAGDLTDTTTILNDDTSLVSILASPTIVSEAVGTTSFFVVLSRPSEADTEIAFKVGAGTATGGGTDYSLLTASPITIAAGSQVGVVTVSIAPDTLPELDETIILDLVSAKSDPTTGALDVVLDPFESTATLTIDDDDGSLASVTDMTVDEDDGTVTLTISLDKMSSGDIDIDFETFDGTALEPGDYTKTKGTATIKAGKTSVDVTVPIIDDAVVEPDETFTFDLTGISGIGAGIDASKDSATVTITDDDFAALSIEATKMVDEDDGTITLLLTRSGSPTVGFTVDLTTIDGSAVDGGDFDSASFTYFDSKTKTDLPLPVVFYPGDLVVPVTFDLVDDFIVEPTETFSVKIDKVTVTSGPAVAITNVISLVTIKDDDSAVVTPSNSGPVDEGDPGDPSLPSTVDVTFALSDLAKDDVIVTYETVLIAGPGDAEAIDFTPVSSSVTISKMTPSATVSIDITADDTVEGTEFFDVKITGVFPVGDADVTVAKADSTTIDIEDTDVFSVEDTLDVSVTKMSFTEGTSGTDTTVSVEIVLSSGDYEGDIVVDLESLVGGSLPGKTPDDFSGKFTVTFTGGSTSEFADFTVTADSIVEPDETFLVEVVGIDHVDHAGDVTGLGADAEVTILDDDEATIEVLSASKLEAGGLALVEVKLVAVGSTTEVQEGFTFDFTKLSGTATAGLDFVGGTASYGFSPGAKPGTASGSVFVPVALLDDTFVEGDEIALLTISGLVDDKIAHGDLSISGSAAALTILDDDAVTVSIMATMPDAKEADPGTDLPVDGEFVVTLSDMVLNATVIVTLDRSGSATEDADYVGKGVPTSVSFAPGKTSVTITVEVIDDTDFEATIETVDLKILSVETVLPGGPVTIGAPDSATVEIRSDEREIDDVSVSGSGWTGSLAPYSLTTGTLHKTSLPWTGLDTVTVKFNDVVDRALTVDSLKLTGISVPTYATSVAHTAGTDTAILTLSSGTIGADRLTLTTEGDLGSPGGVPLDGGADVTEEFNVLPGDADDNGTVDFFDLSAIFGLDGTSNTSLTRFDVNASGDVDFFDLSDAFGFDGVSLPPLPPPPLQAAFGASLSSDLEEFEEEEEGLASVDAAFATL